MAKKAEKKGKQNGRVTKKKAAPKPEAKKRLGRKTAYQEDFVRQAKELCEAGFLDKKLASFFKVTDDTITNWKRQHPEFKAAIIEGRDRFNCEKVEPSLLKLCTGYSVLETTREPFIVREKGEAPKIVDSQLSITKTVTKHIPPNITAIIYWQTNRDKERWQHMSRHEITGKNGKPLVPENSGPMVLMPPMPKTLEEWEKMWEKHAIAEGMLDAPKPITENSAG